MAVTKDLKRGFKWTSLMQLSIIGVQLVSTITLARLLKPSDYALIGMMSIFISISDMIVDSGMGGSLIKKKEVSVTDYSTLFIYNLFVSILLYVILYFVAPLISIYYNKPILTQLVRVISISIVINAFSRVQYVKILKSLNFKIIAFITFFANIISLGTSIFLALKGYGAWALVLQLVVTSIITTVCYTFYNKFIPQFVFSKESFREQFQFGIFLLGSNILTSISENIHSNVLAKLVPLNQTGYFVQANKIKALPVNIFRSIIDNTLFPVFSKITDKDLFALEYKKLSIQLYSIIFPLLTLLIFLSSQIIGILLGNQWKQSGWMLSILLIGVVPLCIQIICRNALKSLGITRQILFNEILKISVSILTLTITYKSGIKAIIISIVVAQLISTLFIMNLVGKKIKYTFAAQLKDLFPLIGINVISFTLLYFSAPYFQLNPLIEILLASVQHFVIVICLCIVFKQSQLLDSLKSFMKVFKWREVTS
jgi:teichuronic acid exporter